MASLLCACEMLEQFINVKVIAQHLKDCENEVANVNCFIAIICYLLVSGKQPFLCLNSQVYVCTISLGIMLLI